MLNSSGPRRRDSSQNLQNTTKPYTKTVAKEQRRSRGEIACAECRRLKVRCDRQIPCSTCVSRGCVALCPNGILPAGDNSRFVSAATDHLKRRMTKMEERMRALEDALAIAQSAESSEPHPLLASEFQCDPGPDPDSSEQESDATTAAVDAIASSFGMLHVDEKKGTMQFFGPSGGSESLLLIESPSERLPPTGAHEDLGPTDIQSLGLPLEINVFFDAFPLAPMGIPTAPVRRIIETFLPPWERAESLGRQLLESMSWMFQIVSCRQLTQELIPSVYSGNKPGTSTASAHDLALLLIILSVASLVDLTLPPYNEDAQRYYILARAAIALDPMTERASLSTVKALHLISIYCGMSGSESNMTNTYAILTLAGRLAQKIGLHVDPSHWRMSDQDVYDRRCYYWSLLQGDTWQSIYSGRPPAVAMTIGNVKIPSENDERRFQQGEYALGFGAWGFKLSEEFLVPILKLTVSAKPPSYSAVLDLDRKIREFEFPPLNDDPDSPDLSVSLGSFPRSHYVELMLIALHRGFFAQAIASPVDPLTSPFSHSFITAYTSAWTVLKTTSEHFARHHLLFSRIWMIWSFAFTSAVIVGAVAVRFPDLQIQPPPLQALQQACLLFENASKTNSRAAKALPVLLKIHERAIQAHSEPESLSQSVIAPTDGLPRLCGKTRIVHLPIQATSSATTTPPSLISSSSSLRDAVPLPPAPLSLPVVPPIPPIPYQPSIHNPQVYYQPNPSYADAGSSSGSRQGAIPAYPPGRLEYTDVTPNPHQQYPVTPAHMPTVDFDLADTWSAFFQQYDRLQ